MKFAVKYAMKYCAVLPMVLVLTACGGGKDDDSQTTVVTPAATESPMPVPDDTAAPAPSPSPTDSATPVPTPSATASPVPAPTPKPSATPSAKATTAAVATKPPEFAVCSACHSTEAGKNGIGPSLAGVFGAKAGHVATYEYSDATKGSGLTWNQATLDRYLADPKGVVPGTKMAYAGIKDAAKRQAMIDYLKTL
jgi:cytochrome c2